MRVFRRFVAVVASLPALPASAAFAIDKPVPQVQVEARIVEASRTLSRDLGVFLRTGADGKPDLLLALPTAVGGKPVDGVQLDFGKGVLDELHAALLPPGWTLQAKRDVALLSGPPLVDLPRLAVAFDADAALKLVVAPRISLESGGAVVLDLRPELQTLNPAREITDVGAVLRLPPRLSPGDRISFWPLDPRFTPAGGTWTIGGVAATQDGGDGRLRYRWDAPRDLAPGAGRDLAVTYVDPWGTKLVDGRAGGLLVFVRPRVADGPEGSGQPRVTGCSPAVLDGDSFCVCGNFPPDAAAALRINGLDVGQYLVASAPTVLNFNLPPTFPAGSLALDAGRVSGFDIADGARGVLIHVGGEIDRNKLKRGESTPLKLWLDGTDQPTDLRLWNTTPQIVTLSGGDDQVVTTSGGSPNQVTRTVGAVRVGDFALHYQLTVDSCPCAKRVEEPLEPPEETYNDDFGPPQEPYEPEPPPIGGRVYFDWLEKIAFWQGEVDGIDCRNPVIDQVLAALLAAITELESYVDRMEAGLDEFLDPQNGHSKEDHAEQVERLARLRAGLATLRKLADDFAKLPPCDPKPPKSVGPPGEIIPPRIDLAIDLPETATNDCREQGRDCQDLLRRFEEAARRARHLRDVADDARRPVEAYDRDRAELARIRAAIAAARQAAIAAYDRERDAERRARAMPGRGFEKDAAAARAEGEKAEAEAARLEKEASAIDARLGREILIGTERKIAAQAAAAADEAGIAAGKLLEEYLRCLVELARKCPGATPSTGGPLQDDAPGDDGPEGEKKPEEPPGGGPVPGLAGEGFGETPTRPGKCGPDLTTAFEATLRRTAERVRALPASEKGIAGGLDFLGDNWPYSWYKRPAAAESGGGDEARWDWDWDDLLIWRHAETGCATPLLCSHTNWLWGQCLSHGFIEDIYEDYVRALLGVGRGLQVAAAGGVASPSEPCEAIGQALADALGSKALRTQEKGASGADAGRAAEDAFARAFARAREGSEFLPLGTYCQKCGAEVETFELDWSLRDWWLDGGRVQHPDGTIEKAKLRTRVDNF